MQVGHHCHRPKLFGDAVPLRSRAVARRAVNREPLLAALKQFGCDRQRVILDEISGACDAPGIHRRVFIRIHRTTRRANRRAARDRPSDWKLRAKSIGKKAVILLRSQFKLPFHVRKDIKRRLAEMLAALAQDSHHRKHTNSENDEEVTHHSSTISMCGLPASSSSLRVSNSEYFGSSHSITTKKRS